MKKQMKQIKKQAGMTLMEQIAALLIAALVVSGALALFNNASSSQKSTQFQSDLVALQSAIKGLYAGQGTYGTTELNSTLSAANKIPSDLSVSAATPPVITHAMNGTISLMGATSAYTITATNIPTDVCVAVLTGISSGWTSVKVGAAAAVSAFPISPATASSATNCAASNANTIVFTGA